MSRSSLVRYSRDGDQFHYRWAARRCLRLLAPGATLVAVTIEGISTAEGGRASTRAGEEVVDVAEYYGSQNFRHASRVDHLQLKHSTARELEAWRPSGLAGTLEGFARRYVGLREGFGSAATDARARFGFVSNRPIGPDVLESVTDLATGATPRHASTAAQLLRHTALPADLVQPFFERLTLQGGEARFTAQSDLLALEAGAYLAADDLDAVLRLKELVTRKATSEAIGDPSITAPDVLQALRVAPDRLLPAPSRLEADTTAIPREQERELGEAIISASQPVLISAPGGVGKSVLATRLPDLMPAGSATVVYDCFGNGEYRQLAHARHPHRVALVQIANELATLGHCEQLLPTPSADAQDYLRSFVGRLQQAVASVRGASTEGLVVLVIDAADNAQMAADEPGAPPAFVRDVLRERLPDGVRLVMLHRPEREHLLAPPPNVRRLELATFSLQESGAMLRRRHPGASAHDIAEFHRLSSANPRVQANALAAEPALKPLLRSLGPDPTTVDDLIAEQLRRALDQVKFDAGRAAGEIDVLCAGLAALRPLIPLKVLSAVSGLTIDAIRSFVTDFGGGRPLLIAGDSVQFRDEPVEDWFRKTYRANEGHLQLFVARLKPLADANPYVAASLPSLMLACGQLDELVEMALSNARLPSDSPLERREIELARLNFALLASLCAQRWSDAARLAMKAGEESAGTERQEQLLRDSPDLVGLLFDPERLQELGARQLFATGGWLGSRYVREAALMSLAPELAGEALGKLRMAEEWLTAWSRSTDKERSEMVVSDEDRADLAYAQLNLHGAETACRELMRWQPDNLWYEATLLLSRRLVDHGRFDQIEALLAAAVQLRAPPIVGAATMALAEVNRAPSKDAIELVFTSRPTKSKTRLRFGPPWLKQLPLPTLAALTEAALGAAAIDPKVLGRRLSRALPKTPPRHLGDRFEGNRSALLQAYTLRAELLDRDLTLEELATDEVRAGLKSGSGDNSQEVREFKTRVGALLPWWRLRARLKVSRAYGRPVELAGEIAAALAKMNRAFGHYDADRYDVQDEVAPIWFDLLCEAGPQGPELAADFEAWIKGLKRPMYIPTWTRLGRKAARSTSLQHLAHGYVRRAVAHEWAGHAEHADSRIETFVGAARAIFSLDRAEADAYLSKAVEVASKLGDDVHVRWAAVLALAESSELADDWDPELGYRLSRSAELCAEYVDRHFDWERTIGAIVGLSPASAVAIVSRWRDREVTWFPEAMRSLVAALEKRSVIDPVLATALICFRFGWPVLQLLDRALASAGDDRLKADILGHVTRYASLDLQSEGFWKEMAAVAERHRISAGEIARLRREMEARVEAAEPSRPTGRRARSLDWGRALRAWPVESAAGALRAREGIRSRRPPFVAARFWQAVFARVPLGTEAAFVRDLMGTPDLDLYDLREFLEAVPDEWRARLAVQSELRAGMAAIARRRCWAIRLHRYASSLPLAQAARLSGLAEESILDQVFAGIAEDTDPASAEDLFNLVPLIARRLPPHEARKALSYSLGLIEASIEPEAGDGAWRAALVVPPDTASALGGLIWGVLGSVNEALRWEAAHVVRALVRLGQTAVLNALLERAVAGPGPFASPSLPFYRWHAVLWLMLALARASHETPHALASAFPLLQSLAQRANPHVMIRHYAGAALLQLESAGVVRSTAAQAASLRALDRPRIAPVTIDYGGGGGFDRYGPSRPERKFIFDFEISRSLMEGLARAFAVTLHDVEELAETVILGDWDQDANGHWDKDPRRNFPSMSYRNSGRGTPVDSYSEYLSFHATFCAAGKLLETHAPRRYAEDRQDEFAQWLGYQLLTRPDELWVSDRRDPTPILPALPPEIAAAHWPWSISRSDFDRALGLDAPQLVIWGSWAQPAGRGQERVSIHSALVQPESAHALLAAAQTAKDAWDYVLPDEGNDNEIDEPPFVLRPWVASHYLERHLDRRDPWGADMRYPPPSPASHVLDRLRLVAADDHRRWFAPGRSTPVFSAQCWATFRSDEGTTAPAPEGERLLINRRSLPSILRRLGLDLILEVHLTREGEKRSYGRREEDEFIEHPRPYFRLYLFRQDGSLETLS